jgi:hypothetical protein
MEKPTVKQFMDERIEGNEGDHAIEKVKAGKFEEAFAYISRDQGNNISGILLIVGPHQYQATISPYIQSADYKGPVDDSGNVVQAKLTSDFGKVKIHECSDGQILEVSVKGSI